MIWRNDCGQSVWCAIRDLVEPYAVLACHVSVGRCLGIDNIATFGVGTAGRRTERHGFKDSSVFEEAGAVAHIGATALGNSGVFCWYSYITPLLTEVSGFSGKHYGADGTGRFGMVAGNLVSGRMSDRYTPGR